MLGYWLAYFIPVFLFLLPNKTTTRNSKIIWPFVGLFFTIFIGLRHHVGGDWLTYTYYYEYIFGSAFVHNLFNPEPGYAVINWLAGYYGAGVHFVNFICSAIFVYGMLSFCRKQPIPLLALSIAIPYIVVVIAMGYTRQSVALGLLFLALNSLNSQKLIKFVIYVALASLFHKSAVVMLPLALFAIKHDRFIRTLGIISFSIIFWYMFLADHYDSLWENYVLSKMKSDGGLLRALMNLLPSIILFIYWKKFKRIWSDSGLWWWWGIITVACIFLVSYASTAVDRIALYLTPIQIVVLSRLPILFERPEERTLVIFFILLYYAAVMFVWLNYATHAGNWVPYRNLLFLGL